MKKMDKTAEYYQQIFEKELNSGRTIRTQKDHSGEYDVLEIEDDEVWRQCYSEDSLARRQLPKYWFVSNYGKLISVEKNKAYLIRAENKQDRDRLAYHIGIRTSNQDTTTKNIFVQNLVGVVFGADIYGKAKDILDEKGIFAFGRLGEPDKIQGHHEDKNTMNNLPSNIQFLTNDSAHKVIHKNFDKADDIIDLMNMASEEEPNKITILVKNGDYRQLNAVEKNQIVFSDKAKYQMYFMNYLMISKNIVDIVIDDILQKKDISYFIEPKYFICMNMIFYKCQYIDEVLEITILSATDTEICNKDYIGCFVDKDNNIFYIPTEE